jgi:arylsulfatase A-like enzyme
MYDDIVNLGGIAGHPATMVGTISYDSLAEFDIRQTDSAVDYIKQHAKSDKPFFMDVNFIKMHNPTHAAPVFRGRSHLGDYSDSLTEMDADIGRIMDEIRADAPNTIVILTADNGAWLDAYPDAGTTGGGSERHQDGHRRDPVRGHDHRESKGRKRRVQGRGGSVRSGG